MKARRIKLHSDKWMQRKADQGKQSRRASWLHHQLAHGKADCTYCGRQTRRDVPDGHIAYATVDHIIPRSAGGYDGPRNWAVSCIKCNQDKGATMLTKPAPLSPERIAELQHRESHLDRWAGNMPDDTKGAE